MKYLCFATFLLIGCGGGLRNRIEVSRVARFASQQYQCPENRVRLVDSHRIRTQAGIGDHWEYTLSVCGYSRTFEVIRNRIREI